LGFRVGGVMVWGLGCTSRNVAREREGERAGERKPDGVVGAGVVPVGIRDRAVPRGSWFRFKVEGLEFGIQGLEIGVWG